MVQGVFYILLAALFWGFFPVIGRLLFAAGIDPLWVASMRITLAALFYLLYGLVSRRLFAVSRKDLPFFFLYGLLSAAGLSVFYLKAVSLLSSAAAAILLYSAPALVTVGSRIFFKEPVTRRRLLALGLTFAGCAFVVGRPFGAGSSVSWQGVLYGLLSGICYASLTLFGRVGLKKYDATLNALLPTICAGACFLAVRPVWAAPFPSLKIFGLYCAIALVGTVIPVWLYLTGMQKGVKGCDASMIATLEPPFAALFGTLFFGDPLGPPQILGVAFVFLGASIPVISSRFGKDQKSLEPSQS